MKVNRKRLAMIFGTAIIVSGISACALQRAQEAEDAQTAMVGLSKEHVLACMGTPASAATVGNTEVWSYNSGNGQTDTFGTASVFGGWHSATGFGSSTTTSRSCKVDVVMTNGQVSRVNYSGPTGGLLTKGEQCAFAVDNCVHQAGGPVAPAQLSAAQNVSVIPAATVVQAPAAPQRPACNAQDREAARAAQAGGFRYSADCD